MKNHTNDCAITSLTPVCTCEPQESRHDNLRREYLRQGVRLINIEGENRILRRKYAAATGRAKALFNLACIFAVMTGASLAIFIMRWGQLW